MDIFSNLLQSSLSVIFFLPPRAPRAKRSQKVEKINRPPSFPGPKKVFSTLLGRVFLISPGPGKNKLLLGYFFGASRLLE